MWHVCTGLHCVLTQWSLFPQDSHQRGHRPAFWSASWSSLRDTSWVPLAFGPPCIAEIRSKAFPENTPRLCDFSFGLIFLDFPSCKWFAEAPFPWGGRGFASPSSPYALERKLSQRPALVGAPCPCSWVQLLPSVHSYVNGGLGCLPLTVSLKLACVCVCARMHFPCSYYPYVVSSSGGSNAFFTPLSDIRKSPPQPPQVF